jgi:hypothetical protein
MDARLDGHGPCPSPSSTVLISTITFERGLRAQLGTATEGQRRVGGALTFQLKVIGNGSRSQRPGRRTRVDPNARFLAYLENPQNPPKLRLCVPVRNRFVCRFALKTKITKW